MRTILIGLIILIFITIQFMRGAGGKYIIEGDGSGYYAYLTSVFVYNTTDFTDVYQVEKSWRGLDYQAHYFHPYKGILINKYYLGTALLILPFFLMAFAFSVISGMPPDGYNFIFQYGVAMAASFYLALGLLFVFKLLRTYAIDKLLIFILLMVLMLGTNLFYYAFLHPSMSHVYSFFAIALFVYLARAYFLTPNYKYLIYAALSLGLILLIRPTNLLIVGALPFLAGKPANLTKGFRFLVSYWYNIPVALSLVLLVFAVQGVFNYYQSGNLLPGSYLEEGFYFLNPSFFSFLFSYRKGFFVYTPMFLLLFPAAVFLFRTNRYQFFTFIGFFVLIVYVLSSWWNWFFGDSFGMRALIDYFPVIIIPIAVLMKSLLTWRKTFQTITVFILLAISFNLLQSYQYHMRIIHPDSMTKEKYWHVFLKTDDSYKYIFGGFSEPVFRFPENAEKMLFRNDFEDNYAHWNNSGIFESPTAFSGEHIARLGNGVVYSPTLVIDGKRLTISANPLYLSVKTMFRELDAEAAADALLVYAETDRMNNLSFYKTFKIKQMPDQITNEWRPAEFGFKVPAWDNETQQVKVYFWHRNAGLFELDDFEISITVLNSEAIQ